MNVIQGLGFDNQVRFYITNSKQLVEELNRINQPSPVVLAALGRSASITGLMGLMLKGNDKLSTTIDGDGPLGKIIVVSNAAGEVKATVANPIVDIPLKENGKLDVSGAVGNGTLHVVKDLGLKESFVGQTELISGEIAEDYAYYFSASEQVPTAISAGVLVDVDYSVKSAGALIIQLLPNSDDDVITKVETAFLSLPPISNLLLDFSLEQIITHIFGNDHQILRESELKHYCDCSLEKFETGIKMLSPADIIDVKKDEYAEVICNFCHKQYKIDTKNL